MHLLSDFVSGEPSCLGSGGWLIRGPGVCMPEWQTVQGGLARGPEGELP